MAYIITNEQIQAYERHLRLEEHSASTILKYAGALRDFYDFLPPDKEVSKELLLEWKEQISADHAASTVNVMISAINSFFAFLCWNDLHIRQIKTQRQIYRDKERELTKAEYMRLLNAARASGNMRLFYLMQTLGATGIRISELRFISIEAIAAGSATVDCKGKQRTVLIPKKLRKALRAYCEEAGIVSGPIFITKHGNPVNRSNIWRHVRFINIPDNVNRRR